MIRDASVADGPTLARFMQIQGKETEDLELVYEDVLKGTDNLLRRPTFGRYFVAYQESAPETLMGMMMIHFETSPEVGGLIWWINSVYVHPDHRKKGVFRSLYDHITAIARTNPLIKCVRLYVELANATAQTVYTKMGMENLDGERGKEFHEIDYVWTE